MKVLVYGNWPDKTQNIHPFFTATYHESEKKEVIKTNFSEGLKLIFVGALESYKSPEIVIEVARELKEKNEMFQLYMCGDGSQRESLDLRKNTYMLDQQVLFLGNVNSQRIKELLQSAHFLVFISKSEGWPKAVAEAMFWGCVPITTDVSCVGDMVGRKGERGQLVTPKPDGIADLIIQLKNDPDTFSKMSSEAMNWSRKYTLDYFESEIKKLI